MKSQLASLSLLLAAASAFPAPQELEVCGPNSNCELVTINGTKVFRFREGMGPGSEDYRARFEQHPKRQEEVDKSKAELKVVMGKTRMQWGCGTDVRKTVDEAMNENCGNEGGCDAGQKKPKDVEKYEGDRKKPTGATLNIKCEGKYYDKEMRDFLHEGMLRTTDKGVETADRKWTVDRSAAANHWGLGDEHGECKEIKFPNYVAVNRFVDQGLKDYIEIHAELVEGEENCLGATILGAIAGAINPMAGRLFSGPAKVLCESAL